MTMMAPDPGSMEVIRVLPLWDQRHGRAGVGELFRPREVLIVDGRRMTLQRGSLDAGSRLPRRRRGLGLCMLELESVIVSPINVECSC